jgi:hypothetical protein
VVTAELKAAVRVPVLCGQSILEREGGGGNSIKTVLYNQHPAMFPACNWTDRICWTKFRLATMRDQLFGGTDMIQLLFIRTGSWDSLVIVVTRWRSGRPRNLGSIPGRRNTFISSPMVLSSFSLRFAVLPSSTYPFTVRIEVVYFHFITLKHIPQSVGLLWTRDRPVAETSIWQHKHSQATNIYTPRGIRTRDPSKRAAADLRLGPRGHWDRLGSFSGGERGPGVQLSLTLSCAELKNE